MSGLRRFRINIVRRAAVVIAVLCLAGCGLNAPDNGNGRMRWRQTAEEGQRETQEDAEGSHEETGSRGQGSEEGAEGSHEETGSRRQESEENMEGSHEETGTGWLESQGDIEAGHRETGQQEAGASDMTDGFGVGANHWKRLKPRFPEPERLSLRLGGSFCDWPDWTGDGGSHIHYQALPAGNNTLGILVPFEFVRDVLEISVLEYQDSTVFLRQGELWAALEMGSQVMSVGQGIGGGIPVADMEKRFLECGPDKREGSLYIPLEAVCLAFGYQADMEVGSLVVELVDDTAGVRNKLPAAYDYRDTGRAVRVRDQGKYGTCWSFASLTALETAMGPSASLEFSADHMSLRNSFSLEQHQGGEYTMSMAYLLAWQGPVLEEEDPYGDNMSPEGLTPSVHVQEICLLPSRDFTAIKKAVFLRGGVQSSLYTSIVDSMSRSVYYSVENSSYCYNGQELPNHDVVIVGWDDQYPKEKFQEEPPGDGAFLCVSSWGQDFGDGGYFYVSYYDSNIGGNGLVYTGIEGTDNYDRIYQSDLCGWVGQVGYSQEKAYGANVYQAEGPEELAAVGFYATKEDTSYKIYVTHRAEKETDLNDRKLVAEGSLEWAGFYTIGLDEPEALEAGERFAIILEVETMSAVHPLAVEYQADELTEAADVTDGEGYISYDGQLWERLEDRYQCNLCLKGYTRVRKDGL